MTGDTRSRFGPPAGTSVAIAVLPSDGGTVASLLQAADQRLLSAKRQRQSGGARRRGA